MSTVPVSPCLFPASALPIAPTLLEENRTFTSNLSLMFACFEQLAIKGCHLRLFLTSSEA